MHYEHAPTRTHQWVTCPEPRPQATVKLLCLPHAGASPRSFFPWTAGLDANIELLPVCLAGRANRMDEPLATRVEDITPSLANAVLPLMDDTVVFFGHSLGALLAFELTLELRRRGLRQPDLLVVSGRTTPGSERALKLHTLPDRLLVREVQRIYGGIPREVLVEPELLQRTLPILRADLQINETYDPALRSRPLSCPLLAVGGTEDPHVTGTELGLWRRQTSGTFRTQQFRGGHFYMAEDQGRAWLLGQLNAAIRGLNG